MSKKRIIITNGVLIAGTIISAILFNRREKRRWEELDNQLKKNSASVEDFTNESNAMIQELDRRITIAKKALAEDDRRIIENYMDNK